MAEFDGGGPGIFGEALRKLRGDWTRKDFVARSGNVISETYLRDLENGNRGPLDPNRIVDMCRGLGVPASTLLDARNLARGSVRLSLSPFASGPRNPIRVALGIKLGRLWNGLTIQQMNRASEALGEG